MIAELTGQDVANASIYRRLLVVAG